MTSQQPLNEVSLARDCLRRLSEEDALLARVSQVLELVGAHGVGLGEVLQDYARQTQAQLREIVKAVRQVIAGIQTADDLKTLEQAPFVMKTVKTVLEMTPNAMQRNKADTLGEKQTVSREEIVALSHSFRESADVARLIAAEESGRSLAALFGAGNELPSAADAASAASARH